MNESEPKRLSASERDRICPLLAAPGIIRGQTLALRLAGETIKLKAPRQYLSKLFDWCQGDMTLSEIEAHSIAQLGDRRFVDFIEALLDSGVLIDTAGLLDHAVRAARAPHWMGRAAERDVWRRGITRLPPRSALDTSLVELEEADASDASNVSSFCTLLAKRRSADAFGPAALSQSAVRRLLHAAYGVQCMGRRSVASAGGFYRLMFHLILLRPAGGLVGGTYVVHFDAEGGVHLEQLHPHRDDVPSFVYHPHLLRNATGLIVVSTDLRPATLKYGNRSYPFALIEAGAVVQNIALAAAELGAGWRTLGGLEDQRLAAHCGLGERDHVLTAGVFGTLPDESVDTASERRTAAVEFAWSEGIPGLPFHLAMARLDTGSGNDAKTFSWGRDANAWTAYDKAVAEATERHAYRQPRALMSAVWDGGERMHDPRELVRYSREQYARAGFPFKPFDPTATYWWVEAARLDGGGSRWVPAECVLHRTALPQGYEDRWLTSCTSSGCASGTTVEMAQASALFELIERDAFMRHWFAQRGGIEVDARTLPIAAVKRIAALTAAGCRVSVQVLDLALLPVWMVLVQHDDRHFTAVGAAAGLDPDDVVHSALSEAETAAYVRLAGLELTPIRPADVVTPADHSNLYAQRRYYRRADALLRVRERIAFDDALRPAVSMDAALTALASRGAVPLWLDLSLRDAPLTLGGQTIVSGRMIAPGLIPIAFGDGTLPLGMIASSSRGARFAHPFP